MLLWIMFGLLLSSLVLWIVGEVIGRRLLRIPSVVIGFVAWSVLVYHMGFDVGHDEAYMDAAAHSSLLAEAVVQRLEEGDDQAVLKVMKPLATPRYASAYFNHDMTQARYELVPPPNIRIPFSP